MMAERKQTPDILSEILAGGAAEPSEPTPRYAPQEELDPNQSKSKPRAARRPTPKAGAEKNPRSADKPAHTAWEYRVVSFQEHRGWRPRFIDGVERSGWTSAPLLHETLAGLAQEGWELVTATSGEALYGADDKRQLYFRRPTNRT